MDKKLEIILKARDMTQRAFEQTDSKIQKLTKSVFSLQGAFAAAASLAGMGYFVKTNLDVADTLTKTADKLGVSTAALQEYRYAASQSGVAQNALDMGLQRFTRRVAEAVQGKGELKDVLKQYGIAVTDAGGRTRNTSDVLDDLANVIKNTEDKSERLRIAFKAFDSEGVAMVNMLMDGADGLDKFRKEANDLGIVMDEKLLRGAADANDQLDKLGRIVKVHVVSAVAEVAPLIAKLAKELTDSGPKIKVYVQDMISVGTAAVGAAAKVAYFVDSVGKGLGILAGKAMYGEEDQALIENEKKIVETEKRIARLTEKLDRPTGLMKAPAHVVEQWKKDLEDLKNGLAVLEKNRERLIAGPGPAPKLDLGGTVTTAGTAANVENKVRAASAATETLAYDIGLVNYELRMVNKAGEAAWAAYQERVNQSVLDTDKFREGIEATRIAENQLAIDVEVGFDQTMKSIGESAGGMNEEIKNAMTGWASHWSSTLNDMVWGAETSFNQIIESFAQMITQMILQKTIVEPLVGGFTSFLGFKKGGVFDGGHIVPMARGAVVDRPVIFPMARGYGLMGEAGPEGVLPLTRTRSGDLGVRAEGAGGGAVIVNYSPVINAIDTQTGLQFLAGHKDVIVGLVNRAFNLRGRRGPLS